MIQACNHYYTGIHRDVSRSIKKAGSLYRNMAIESMSSYIGDVPIILIPIPNSKGDRSANLELCRGIARLKSCIVMDVLRSSSRPSLYKVRAEGGQMDIAWNLVQDIPRGGVVFIDNVSCTGLSINRAIEVVGRGRGLVYASANMEFIRSQVK